MEDVIMELSDLIIKNVPLLFDRWNREGGGDFDTLKLLHDNIDDKDLIAVAYTNTNKSGTIGQTIEAWSPKEDGYMLRFSIDIENGKYTNREWNNARDMTEDQIMQARDPDLFGGLVKLVLVGKLDNLEYIELDY